MLATTHTTLYKNVSLKFSLAAKDEPIRYCVRQSVSRSVSGAVTPVADRPGAIGWNADGRKADSIVGRRPKKPIFFQFCPIVDRLDTDNF